MASHDELDPLGNDWKSRSDRGIAVNRELTYAIAVGQHIPVEALTRILSDLAGRVSGILQTLPERFRELGMDTESVAVASEIVADCQVQISVGLDSAAEEAMGVVDAIEMEMLDATESKPSEAVRGPKERKKETKSKTVQGRKGRPQGGSMKQ